MLKILEEARRKRGEPKILLEEIKKVSTDEGNEDLADAEKVAVEKAAGEILKKARRKRREPKVEAQKAVVEKEENLAQKELLEKELQKKGTILDRNSEPDSSSAPGTEEVVLYENYEDYLASVGGEEQTGPEIALDTVNNGSVAKVESRDEPTSEEGALLRDQLELSEARLKQQETKHNEDVKFYQKKLQMKEKMEEASRIRHQAEVKKKEEELRAQDAEMLKLHSRLAEEKREKDEAIKKLVAIQSILSNTQGSGAMKSEGEFVEKFEDDKGASAGVKREADSSEPSTSLDSSPSSKRRKTTPKKNKNDHEDAMKVNEEIIKKEDKEEKSKEEMKVEKEQL